MKKSLFLILFFFSCASFSRASWAAGDAKAGEAKATTCFACHGVKGISSNDLWPNLAGQKQSYMIKQIKAFKDGTRADPLMSPQAKALSDQDMENITAFFSSLR